MVKEGVGEKSISIKEAGLCTQKREGLLVHYGDVLSVQAVQVLGGRHEQRIRSRGILYLQW